MQIFDSYTAAKPRHVSTTDKQLENKVIIRRAWDQSKAQNSYVRLVHSLRLLGVAEEKGEEWGPLRWLKVQHGLKGVQVLQYPWELAHLEVAVARWIKGRNRRSPGMRRATETREGGHGRSRATLEQVEEDLEQDFLEDGEDEDDEEVEEVARADFPGRRGNPAALRLFQAVTEARETARKANNEVAKANETVARRSAELMTHLAKERNHTGGPIFPRRHLEAPRQANYPWRST
ncbi:hypothetical protein F5883DRAFT_655326 [Diaporthe sp. PMI_573]|nr:hypothetical protein F5883DRAFT_655326 [Diaporthaceae sp. PMI_573]